MPLRDRSSDRPTGAAQRAPEAPDILHWKARAPGTAMVMAMDATGGGAVAGGSDSTRGRPLLGFLSARPGAVAAIASHRRPVRHRRRQGWGKACKAFRAVH